MERGREGRKFQERGNERLMWRMHGRMEDGRMGAVVVRLCWAGCGVESERQMFTMKTNAGSSHARIFACRLARGGRCTNIRDSTSS